MHQTTDSAMDPEKVPGVEYYKEQAVQCLKRGEYREAVLFLTTAIHSQDTPDAGLYCIRSRTYIKLDMLYLAYEDAEKAVIYKPNNPDVSCGWERCGMGFPESPLMNLLISRLLSVTERSTWQQDAMRWH